MNEKGEGIERRRRKRDIMDKERYCWDIPPKPGDYSSSRPFTAISWCSTRVFLVTGRWEGGEGGSSPPSSNKPLAPPARFPYI
jgi:hypothetical protein